VSALSAGYQLELMQDRETSRFAADEMRWAQLMASAQAGNEVDYRQLLAEISEAVGKYLRARLGGYDFVEDCVQEVLISVHQARHTYDARRAFRPWLFAIVRHKAIDAMRRGQVRSRERLAAGHFCESTVSGPDKEIASGQLLLGLPEGLQQALVLTKIQGMTSSEAARSLSISESALKVRVHRAMGKLKRLLELEAA
jgi:RNA polymerase sigma-70 factor, ECF subfamily